MKKIFSFLFFFIACFSMATLRADDGLHSQPSSIPTKMPRLFKLTENSDGQTIPICLKDQIEISLQGEESNSIAYSSGSGNQHGYRWDFDEDSENNILTNLTKPEEIVHAPYDFEQFNNLGWITKPTTYRSTFTPSEAGVTTLIFKKYFYSNSTVRELDGSLPWKDPVETIQFTINVVDKFPIPVSDRWPIS